MTDPLSIDALMMHELNVLAGIEKTGDYTYTDQFLAKREQFWTKQQSGRIFCTISLFAKIKAGEGSLPGELLGTIATKPIIYGFGTGGIGNLEDLEVRTKKKSNVLSIVARYAISGEGYFKVVISKAVTELADVADLYYGEKKDVFLETTPVDLTPEVIYYSPYDWAAANREARIKEYDFGFTFVSCSKI